MKTQKINERGITLIALVITIIVLLILAGVTLNILINSGILDNSQKAVDLYKKQQAEEKLEIAISDYRTSQYLDKKEFEDAVEGVGGSATYNEDAKEYDVEIDGFNFKVSDETLGKKEDSSSKIEMIKFFVAEKEYACPKGWTWRQFINSDYNIDNFLDIDGATPEGITFTDGELVSYKGAMSDSDSMSDVKELNPFKSGIFESQIEFLRGNLFSSYVLVPDDYDEYGSSLLNHMIWEDDVIITDGNYKWCSAYVISRSTD